MGCDGCLETAFGAFLGFLDVCIILGMVVGLAGLLNGNPLGLLVILGGAVLLLLLHLLSEFLADKVL